VGYSTIKWLVDVNTTTRPLTEPAFHSDDVDHVADYRSISVLALVSLLIGLASPLSLFGRGFLLLPLAGIMFSLIAMRRIAISERRLGGRWAATIGIALCVASGSCALARDAVSRQLRAGQAERFARAWLAQIASNQLEQAFKQTYDGSRPAAPREPGMPPTEKSPYEAFINDPLIQKIGAAGKSATFELVDTLGYTPQTRSVVSVVQRFRITPAGDAAQSASTDAFEADLTLLRSHYGKEHKHWLMTRYESANAKLPP